MSRWVGVLAALVWVSGACLADVQVSFLDAEGRGSVRVRPGQEVLVHVGVDGSALDIQAADLVLSLTSQTYGAPALQPKPADLGAEAWLGGIFDLSGSVSANVLAQEIAPGQLKVVLDYLNPESPANGPGTLVVVPLLVPSHAPAGTLWTVGPPDDSGGTAIAISDGEGDLPIGSILELTLWTPLPGDVDADGRVTVLDALTLLRVVARIAEPTADQLSQLDADGNQVVNVLDVVRVLKVVAGLAS